MGLDQFWQQTDAVGKLVAWLLLAMSVLSWFLIVWKSAMLWRARRGFAQARAAFWQQATLEDGERACRALDASGAAGLLAAAALAAAAPQSRLAAKKTLADRATAALRDALGAVGARLNLGQTLLASIGSTAPFIGLFGTVWGIYHALISIGQGGSIALDKISGPVGEALIMTAAGLAVAIPAVLAYNIFGRVIRLLEAELEGFAHDLRALLLAEQDGAAQPQAGN
jgi:biopolymer transport protein ExbB